MSELNILNIDTNIRENFEKEFKKLIDHEKKLQEINHSIENKNLSRRIKINLEKIKNDLCQYIEELKTKKNFFFYLMETVPFIEEYKKILETPVKVSFIGKPVKNNKVKERIINDYLKIASKYLDITLEKNDELQKISCQNCLNQKDFEVINGNTYICTKCYARQIIMKHDSSYNDINRVDTSSKYMYDRKVHFRDCIKQYQGKQNSTIPQKVYDDLEEQFSRHHLLDENSETDKKLKFKNITKKHILMFLKELNYAKHYENVNLIHCNFTGIQPDDISHLETQLLNDFDLLTDLYDKKFKHINRKNFINTQYVLYQLLCKYHHPCKKEEFIILKTIDRKFFHDEICKILFEELGWNHTPSF